MGISKVKVIWVMLPRQSCVFGSVSVLSYIPKTYFIFDPSLNSARDSGQGFSDEIGIALHIRELRPKIGFCL